MRVAKRVRAWIQSTFPTGVTIYRNARQALYNPSLESVFSAIYQKNLWQNSESVSGRGSTLIHTQVNMDPLPLLLKELNAEKFFQGAGGDFNWVRHSKLKGVVEYIEF